MPLLSPGHPRTDAGGAMEEVSAVVVNHNGGAQILRCLHALEQLQPGPTELLVVDNGSSDGSPAAVRAAFPHVRVLELGRNLGPAAARNAGLRSARAARVLLVDDDVYLAPDCLRRLLERQARPGAAAVVPRLVLLPEADLIQADGGDVHFVGTMTLRNSRQPVGTDGGAPHAIGAFSSSCVLVDRDCVLDAGGFDETYFIYLEDMELGLRLRAFGQHLLCEPAAVAFHERGAGTPGLSFRDQGFYPRRRAFLTMRNRQRTLLLHYRLRSLLLLAPALALYEIAAFGFALRRGWLRPWLRAWLWQIAHARETWQRRRWIQARRQVDDGRLLVAGPLPVAPGLLQSSLEGRAAAGLAWVLERYWRLVQPRLGGARPEWTRAAAPEA
jgi:GT2 family glycosyltransferase